MTNISNLRKRARALAGLPQISISQVARHFRVDRDTARKVLRAHGVRPVPSPHGHPRYSWVDIWRLEGVSETKILDPSFHSDLMEPLQTAEALARAHGCTPTTVRNWCREKKLQAIRIGRSIRFRTPDEAIEEGTCDDAPGDAA